MRLQSEVKEWFANPELPAADSSRYHFIGIGGAGMSALARILLHRGARVSGSDIADSPTIADLRSRGATIFFGHAASNLGDADVAVVSDAIDLLDNPETTEARNREVRLLRRSQLLGRLLKGYRVYAVTGSHGKSTTTALLAQVFVDAGLDPVAIVGADVPGFEGNVRLGYGSIAVIEACEAYDSFHDIGPDVVVLTNLEAEHLDYHKTWEKLRESVARFASSGKQFIYCEEDAGAREVASQVGSGTPYGFKRSGATYEDGDLMVDGRVTPLRVLGRHNALNALGAAAAAALEGIGQENALDSLARANGCLRRLQYVGDEAGVKVYDDYAHHPTEIAASIQALKEAEQGRRLLVVFQPHLYSRTQHNLEGFGPALKAADLVFITDIYPAREKPVAGVSSALIVERLEALGVNCRYVPSRHLLPREVSKVAQPGDVAVGMGAGTIESFAPEFIAELRRRSEPLRVLVMYGGDSAEREVSIWSGKMAADALRKAGYVVQEADPADILLRPESVSDLIGSKRPDIVFLAMHGTGAEDGAIQGFLESLHLPYTGSGIKASALAMDKEHTKNILGANGLPVPKGILVKTADEALEFDLPCVVKPNAQGSTIGLTFVRRREDLGPAIARALKYDEAALVEELIEGVEISVPVLGEEALQAVEICPRKGSYDFAAKYTPGETEEIVPARISDEETRLSKEYALAAHKAMGAADVSRTDFIVSTERIVVLEINTLPGLTQTSLLPKSAESAGISYEQLCERILLSAIKRYGIAKK